MAKKETESGKAPEVTDRMMTAVKAASRILEPFKGSIPKELRDQLMSGIAADGEPQPGEVMADKKASATMSPEPVKEEHKIEAMKAAKGAYKEALKKLGYPKYPTKQIEQKSDKDMDEECEKAAKKMDDEDDESEEKDKKESSKKADKKDIKKEGSMPNADEKEGVFKALLSDVPKETKGALEAIFKSHQELVKKNDELTTKLVETERAAKRKDFVAKAAGFKHLGMNTEELADTMLALSESAPKQLEVVEKMLSAADEQVSKGALFSEIGSQLPSGAATTWEKIEKAAEGYVAKSGEKVSKAEAIDRFIQTTDGKRLYEDYMNNHASNKGRG